jgi:dihydroneopterin aldolase
VEVGSGGGVNLIERLASLIAEMLLREYPTREVRVRLRKLTAPLGGIHGVPSVELVRR